MKISFIGDIMCELTTLKSAKSCDGYDFNSTFSKVKDLFSDADFVIGNLEAPLAGEDAEYTKSFYVFNAPDELVDAVKNAGIDLCFYC